MTYLPQSPVKAKFQAITGKVGKVLLDYFKMGGQIPLGRDAAAISAYSLILLKTVPSASESRSYFIVQLAAILVGATRLPSSLLLSTIERSPASLSGSRYSPSY